MNKTQHNSDRIRDAVTGKLPNTEEFKSMNERLKPTDIYRPGTTVMRSPEFYLIASDRECLSRMNDLLLKDGYLAVSDRTGEYKYYVDARKSTYHAKKVIYDILADHDDDQYESRTRTYLKADIIEEVVYQTGLSKSHTGTQYIITALTKFPLPPEHYLPLSKNYYPNIASHHRSTSRKVERAIQYAIRGVHDETSNLQMLRMLYDRIEAKLRQREEMSHIAEQSMRQEIDKAEREIIRPNFETKHVGDEEVAS